MDNDEDPIVDAVLAVTTAAHTAQLLTNVVDAARRITGAEYGALSVLASDGHPATFIHSGVQAEVAEHLADPQGRGVLSAIEADTVVMVQDVRSHPQFTGFPAGHPPITSFLGVPIVVDGALRGRLYLAQKPGGFTDRDQHGVQALARAAGHAIDTSDVVRLARTRERWLAVGQEVTTAMLEGSEAEDALELIAARLRVVAEADAACLVLPGMGEDWVIEIADGAAAPELVGILMPTQGRAHRVLASRSGIVVRSFERTTSLRVPQFGQFGPALYAPLVVGEQSTGVIILLRARGAPEFTPTELQIAESFARQAALALELAQARRSQDRAALLDERARIARDLHDLAIQHLFATGLAIAHARDDLPSSASGKLGQALAGLDEAIAQIREIVHALHRDAVPTDPMERVRRELDLTSSALGFEPALRLLPNALTVESWAQAATLELIDDVVAVVREGLSNAAKHARADTVAVEVEVGTAAVDIRVVDDGRGIATDRSRSSGLANLARRAENWGGTFQVQPGDDGGTVLSWRAHP
ncbi:MAG: GAF domain-containing sensor histidine kinase [Beutenbergiaceae bacterium]